LGLGRGGGGPEEDVRASEKSKTKCPECAYHHHYSKRGANAREKKKFAEQKKRDQEKGNIRQRR